jgi:hypothetical protein
LDLLEINAIALNNLSMDESTPMTDEEFEQWQAHRILNRTAALRTELVMVEKKRQALSEFMVEARSHEGDMLEWLLSLEHQDYPGKELGLSITLYRKAED